MNTATIESWPNKLRALLRGAWLSILTPTISLLLVVAGEELALPNAWVWLAITIILFLGFGVLIRAQFARRRRHADVFASFWVAQLLGLVLVAGVLLTLFRW